MDGCKDGVPYMSSQATGTLTVDPTHIISFKFRL